MHASRLGFSLYIDYPDRCLVVIIHLTGFAEPFQRLTKLKISSTDPMNTGDCSGVEFALAPMSQVKLNW